MSENKERIKKIKWVILFICLICFLAIAEDVLEDEIFNADISFYNFLSEHVISDSLTPIVKVITNFGGIVCLVILAILSFVIRKNKKIFRPAGQTVAPRGEYCYNREKPPPVVLEERRLLTQRNEI